MCCEPVGTLSLSGSAISLTLDWPCRCLRSVENWATASTRGHKVSIHEDFKLMGLNPTGTPGSHLPSSSSTKDKSIDYRRPYAGILYHCYFENAPTKAPLDEGAFTAVYFFQPSHLYLFRRVTRRVRASCVGRIQNPPSVEPPYNTSVDGSNLESSVELSHNTSARHST